ncbi:hypothetical protein P4B35_10155 [Pontiellaceae bacterium B12227]|nr:hypothetical protein [Pontiellaceae bacterium B12227]
MSFERFLVDRFGLDKEGRTSYLDMAFDEAKKFRRYAEEATNERTSEVLATVGDSLEKRATGRFIASGKMMLELRGEDFALKSLPDSTRDLTQSDLYGLLDEYLQHTGSELRIDPEQEKYLLAPDGRKSGWCTMTYRAGETPERGNFMLVTLNPYAFKRFEE